MSNFTIEPKYRNENVSEPRPGWVEIDGKWHNIVFVYDDAEKQFKMYIDGVVATRMNGMHIELNPLEAAETGVGIHDTAYG